MGGALYSNAYAEIQNYQEIGAASVSVWIGNTFELRCIKTQIENARSGVFNLGASQAQLCNSKALRESKPLLLLMT